MHVTLVSLNGLQFDDNAQEVRVKTPIGHMVVLPGHEPITAVTSPGPVIIVDSTNKEEVFASYGGMFEVSGDVVRILVDEVDHVDTLIESEIQDALKQAKSLKVKAKDQRELDEAQSLIDRQLVRLEVARIRRRPRS